MNAIVTAATVLMAVALSAIAHACARSRGLRLHLGVTLGIAAGMCALVLAALACAGEAISWPAAVILSCASVCAATDLQTGRIFDRVLIASLAAIVPANLYAGRSYDAAVGALACGAAVFAPFALSRGRAMGFADVKFAGVAGLALGSVPSLEALWVACVSGGGVAAVALLTGRACRRTEMPFGAFLAFGVCVALVLRWA